MKQLAVILLLAQVNSVPPDVLQKFQSNVEKGDTEVERQEEQDEFIKSHRYDVPTPEKSSPRRKDKEERDKENRHGRDDIEQVER